MQWSAMKNVIISSVINGTGRAYYYYVLALLIMDYCYNPGGEYVKDGCCHLVVIEGSRDRRREFARFRSDRRK